jgi:hypothetical protein
MVMKEGKFELFAFIDEESVETFENFNCEIEIDDKWNEIYYVKFEVDNSSEAFMQMDLMENDYGIVFHCEHENEFYSKEALEEVFN